MSKNILIVLRDLRVGNGIAECIRNYYDALLEQQFRVDFLLLRDVESQFSARAKENGNVYIVPQSKIRVSLAVKKYVTEVIETGNYCIVHVNLPGPIGACILKSAKDSNIPVRIYHSHNPRNTLNLKAKISSGIFNPLCVKYASDYLACSESAGKSVFGEKRFSVVKNCIDVDSFQYKPEKRALLRSELGISEDVLVFGSVGRLEEQKNPLFAIQCFEAYKKDINDNVAFIWIGDGSLRLNLEKYILQNNIKDIYFMGSRNDVSDWYSAMDVFLLPSRFEGLGIVFIEAQAAGLCAFGSDRVPTDVNVSPLMHHLNVNYSPVIWAKSIEENYDASFDRDSALVYVKNSGYDINGSRQELGKIYYETLHKHGYV